MADQENPAENGHYEEGEEAHDETWNQHSHSTGVHAEAGPAFGIEAAPGGELLG